MQHIGRGVSPSGGIGDDDSAAVVPIRRYIGATLFVFFSAGIFFYWSAFPLVNTIFSQGYQNIAIPPSPNVYTNSRYKCDWWQVLLLTFNGLLPMTLMFALLNNEYEEYTRVHKVFTYTMLFINCIVLIALSLRWPLFCNTSYSERFSACNDYRWCCVYFPSQWCPNWSACTPGVTSGDLSRNSEMTQHWAFTWVFILLAWWHASINRDMREYGVLK